MEEKFLTIGTICILKNAKKKIMITGFLSKKEGESTVYDYIGCLYPEGILSSQKKLLFNHEQIEAVYFKGYETDESKKFNLFLHKVVEKTNEKEDENPEFLDAIETLEYIDMNTPTATIITEE